jgi:hypothetical protein
LLGACRCGAARIDRHAKPRAQQLPPLTLRDHHPVVTIIAVGRIFLQQRGGR